MPIARSALTVLPVALSRMELRIVDAALKLSWEQRRTLSYRYHEEGSPRAPDLIVVAASYIERLKSRLGDYFGNADRSGLPLIQLSGASAMAAHPRTRRSLTPFGLLECMDRTAQQEPKANPVSEQASGYADYPRSQQLHLSEALRAQLRESLITDISNFFRLPVLLDLIGKSKTNTNLETSRVPWSVPQSSSLTTPP